MLLYSAQYVLTASEKIKETAHWEVDVQVEVFHSELGANRLVNGLFKGKTLLYSDLNHVVLRILPKFVSEAGDNAILVSSHIDTVFSTYAFLHLFNLLFQTVAKGFNIFCQLVKCVFS